MHRNTLRTGLLATLATAGIAAALAGSGPSASAASPSGEPGATTVSTARTTTEHQKGIVLECAGDGVLVTLYENSAYVNALTVILGDPDEGHFGYAEQATPFVVDGALDAGVDVEGTAVRVTGTVVEDGRPTRVVEPIQDGGEQIVSRGTNTPLAADLVAHVGGVDVPLTCSPAFAFDLETRRTVLYGR